MHNIDVEAPRWIAGYERLADTLADGYDMCIHEYTNDMSARELLERYSEHPTIRQFEQRIRMADEKIVAILKPTKRCICGDYPTSHFWYWGYPPNSPELENDLREIGAI
ncbi:MAG TPA: hypothetical protein PKD64_15710 [Pirellulaceae bacterium]|nr:hypothetical protein [Pirellulaceae bacterium]HMO93633.1 hypothetical protein [Pirellulaceae bacterium]HMP70505.1 hypothetical protein [Pirellulaceae bacterium]